jgi:serine/threonine protein kinase
MTTEEADPLKQLLEESRPAMSQVGRTLRLRATMAAVLGPSEEPVRMGRYVVQRRVSAGGMGDVYLGVDPRCGAPVAIKVMLHSTPSDRARFVREALVLRALDHPQVVRYVDHGQDEQGVPFLVMEWLDGHDLAAHLAACGAMSVDEVVELGAALASSLHAAHESGVVHRDVKPQNVMLVNDSLSSPRLIDFGMAWSARNTYGGGRLTAAGTVIGSPNYMAPEQLQGSCDAKSDIYGLGATLFQCLTGEPPFAGARQAALVLAILTEALPSIGNYRNDVPLPVDRLLQRMVSKNPADRPSDMAEVAATLALARSR